MPKKFDNGQLRGAYSAGFEAGLKTGIERMRAEGWRKAKDDELPEIGEVVKTLVPTFPSGWIGLGEVIDNEGAIAVLMLDRLNGDPDHDRRQRAHVAPWEIARRQTREA